MKAKQLLRAAIHPRAIGAPIETLAQDKSVGQQMTPAAVHFPIEGELPSLGSATAWLNSQPLTATGLRGKVVLIDFWTYTCINWLRSLPYVRTWAEKYQDQGVVVIGVHSPEFAFEKDIENVRRAAKDMRVEYPKRLFTRSLRHGSGLDSSPNWREIGMDIDANGQGVVEEKR